MRFLNHSLWESFNVSLCLHGQDILIIDLEKRWPEQKIGKISQIGKAWYFQGIDGIVHLGTKESVEMAIDAFLYRYFFT